MRKTMLGCVLMAVSLLAVPVFADETECVPDNTVTTELEDGVLTIRIEESNEKEQDPDFWWETYTGDKGDASFVELITQSTDEEGYAYAGSFRAIDDGEDTIRLVHTNGHYTKEYLDFDVVTENGEIKETTGGGQAFETKAEDLAPILEGVWDEMDGTNVLEISEAPDGGLRFVVSNGSGRDGMATFYTMTAYYDAVEDALVYWDGTEETATIEAEGEIETDQAETESAGEGTGLFALELQEDDSIGIFWKDDTFGNVDVNMFVKAE